MGIFKDAHIAYQDVVDRTADIMQAGSKFNPTGEDQIWSAIGHLDYDLADQLTDVFYYEAALVCIERGNLPLDNPAWQALVVRLAYNAITDADNFAYIIEHSRFSVSDIQRMLDLAAGAVLQHPNFQLTGFQHISPK
jgi:hypothetical protein